MKLIRSAKTSALVLTAALLAAFPLAAQTVPNPLNGDIFLAFRASGGQGGSTSYIVNIGQDSIYRTAAAGSSFTLTTIGDIGLDLDSLYGSDWDTRSDLSWGLFGLLNSASPALYGSRERPSVSTGSIPWSALPLISRNGVSSQLASVIEGIRGYRGRPATANSLVAALQPNASEASSYNFQVATPGTTDFGSLSEWDSIEADFGGGVSSALLDLFRISGNATTPVQNLGYFRVSATGQVTFTKPAPNSNVDTDGDGQTDAQETLAGTNPNSGTDFFRVQQIVPNQNGPVLIQFTSALNRNYELEYSENLLPNAWQLVGTINSAAGGPAQFSDNDPVRRARLIGFYRVKVSQ